MFPFSLALLCLVAHKRFFRRALASANLVGVVVSQDARVAAAVLAAAVRCATPPSARSHALIDDSLSIVVVRRSGMSTSRNDAAPRDVKV